jgi:hypothetical protein
VQLCDACSRILALAVTLHLVLELLSFCRELAKVAPASLQLDCSIDSGAALLGLQRLDEAEGILHDALATCQEESSVVAVSTVSETIRLLESPKLSERRDASCPV